MACKRKVIAKESSYNSAVHGGGTRKKSTTKQITFMINSNYN